MDLHLEDHALLGDLETAALIGRDGSVDWLCLPRFDSPAAFAALLGTPAYGFWRLAPSVARARPHRAYRPGTLVLDTVWETADGAVRITDFMPPRATRPCLVRRVEGIRGAVPVHGVLRPRFHHGRILPWLHGAGPCTVAVAGPDALWVRVDGAAHETLDPATGTATLDTVLAPGQRCAVTLVWAPSHLVDPPAELAVPAQTLLKETVAFWRSWSGHCLLEGPGRETVLRSLITWKALTHAPTGAVINAPTTSIPYGPDGAHDGDGRLCRLDGFGADLATLLHCGLRTEAADRIAWLLRTTAGEAEGLQAVYGIAGERRLRQVDATWFADRPDSRPVRFGDADAGRFRFEAYGDALAALDTALRARLPLPGPDVARFAEDLTRTVERAWPRAAPRASVHEALMAWVAVDRGLRIARLLGRDGAASERRALRAGIRRQVEAVARVAVQEGTVAVCAGFHGIWHPHVRAALDAPRPAAPRTADELRRVQVLARSGRHDEAMAVFERVLTARNDVGLLAERWDPATGRRLGNAPGAGAHLTLAGTAHALGAAGLSARRPTGAPCRSPRSPAASGRRRSA
ncbi:glycoside hydrolase family 15 protein [Streptomyces sp. VRA16 Mangrove soil]|uniref:glycoside hydrolase family 15 protein n=1 Tax=Streptomyces sp. VRA16 Mangrove soil TaxID=2817434 RepID=UPI001A9CD09A|nr:trehalase-like domain-containing protein [Streptomyces sp. VRA16 Mangrove soil]MBO1332909.1 glycoside hydrolase family 15 protein [Streptomyces sp. VRA16 Mangrove soil]